MAKNKKDNMVYDLMHGKKKGNPFDQAGRSNKSGQNRRMKTSGGMGQKTFNRKTP